jgi:threonine 3-dehydrogenase
MGHEMVGEVADPATATQARRPRHRRPELYCGNCFHCRIGQTHLCPNGQLLGRDANGGFRRVPAAPTSQVFQLPDSH